MHYKPLIVIVISSFILLFTNDLRAVCPDGYTQRSVAFTYTNPTCQGTIYYCYMIDPMGVTHITYDRTEMDISCAFDITYNLDFWRAVEMAMISDLFTAPIYPPCPLQSTLAIFTRVDCWKFVNDPNHGVLKLVACISQGKCECTYKICTDHSLLVPQNVITPLGCIPIGVEMCPSGQPQLPPPGKTIYEEWETECRNLGCN